MTDSRKTIFTVMAAAGVAFIITGVFIASITTAFPIAIVFLVAGTGLFASNCLFLISYRKMHRRLFERKRCSLIVVAKEEAGRYQVPCGRPEVPSSWARSEHSCAKSAAVSYEQHAAGDQSRANCRGPARHNGGCGRPDYRHGHRVRGYAQQFCLRPSR